MKSILTCLLLVFTLRAHALVNIELDAGINTFEREGSAKETQSTAFRLGASFSLMPLIDIDLKLGSSSGESDDKIANLSGEIKPLEEEKTSFFTVGASYKAINWFRVGGGLIYQSSEFTSNSSITKNTITKHNDLGYYLEGGLYHKFSIIGGSLTLVHQKAGKVDSQMILLGIIVGL